MLKLSSGCAAQVPLHILLLVVFFGHVYLWFLLYSVESYSCFAFCKFFSLFPYPPAQDKWTPTVVSLQQSATLRRYTRCRKLSASLFPTKTHSSRLCFIRLTGPVSVGPGHEPHAPPYFVVTRDEEWSNFSIFAAVCVPLLRKHVCGSIKTSDQKERNEGRKRESNYGVFKCQSVRVQVVSQKLFNEFWLNLLLGFRKTVSLI
jgi:hypothetical protein